MDKYASVNRTTVTLQPYSYRLMTQMNLCPTQA